MSSEDNAELVEQARSELRRIQERQAAIEEKLNRLHDVAAVVSSRDGAVTVEMSAGGVVKQVELSDSALRIGAAELSASITDTLRRATAVASEGSEADTPEQPPVVTAPDTEPYDGDDEAVFSGLFDT